MMQPTGVAAHDSAVLSAEVVRQAVISSAVNNSVDIGPFIHALRNLNQAV